LWGISVGVVRVDNTNQKLGSVPEEIGDWARRIGDGGAIGNERCGSVNNSAIS